MLLPDIQVREQAARTFDQNLVVVAGAGTGKTSLLVERAVNLFLSDETALDHSLLMTFTNKAAAELRQRIAGTVMQVSAATGGEQRKDPPESSEAHRVLEWIRMGHDDDVIHQRTQVIMDHLETATIGTIHGFASELLRRHPLEAKLPPNFTPDDGEQRKFLFQEAWPRFMVEELQAPGERSLYWERTLADFPLAVVKKLAQILIRRPAAMDHLVRHGYNTPDPQVWFEDEVRRALDQLQQYSPEDIGTGNAFTQWKSFCSMLTLFLENGLRGLAEFSIEETGLNLLGTPYSDRSVSKEIKAELKSVTEDVQKLIRKLVSLENRDLEALSQVLRAFAETYHREASRLGMPAMDDLLIRARTLLREHPAILEAESARARWLFIDEFQDNDPLQYEIAFLLSGENDSSAQHSETWPSLKPGRLFIVGDPKQSIYRFRGADITAFQNALTHIESYGGTKLDLVANFRSVPGVLESANLLFNGWIGENPDRSVDPEYVDLKPVRKPEREPAVELISVEAPPNQDFREAEAGVLAQLLLELVQTGKARQRDLAVLFRSTTQLPIYTRALHDCGLSFVVEGGKSFFERPEVVEGIALLRALANPADAVAFVAVCRGSFGGVADEELTRFASKGLSFSWRRSGTLDQALEDCPSLRRVVHRLQELAQAGRKLPVDEFIHTVLLDSELSFLMSAFQDGAQRIVNLRKLAERGASISLTRMLSLEATLDVLEDSLLGDNKEWESPLADENLDAVRILTIHKAKGLEYPYVFMPDFPAERTNDSDQGFALGRLDGKPVLSLSADYGKNDVIGTTVRDQEKEHGKAEFKRLMYVAMTRARDKLVLVNARKSFGTARWLNGLATQWGYVVEDKQFPPEGSLAGGLVNHRVLSPEPVSAEALAAPDSEQHVNAALKFTAAVEQAGHVPRHTWRTPSQYDKPERAVPPAGTPAPELASRVGNTVHRALEMWDFGHAAALIENCKKSAALFCNSVWTAEQIAEEAVKICTEFAQSDTASRLAGAEVLGREVPILMRDSKDCTVHGTADLLYRFEDKLIVADYKTDFETGGEAALKYAPQLADYAKAVMLALGLDELPGQEVLFVRTGERIPLGIRRKTRS